MIPFRKQIKHHKAICVSSPNNKNYLTVKIVVFDIRILNLKLGGSFKMSKSNFWQNFNGLQKEIELILKWKNKSFLLRF